MNPWLYALGLLVLVSLLPSIGYGLLNWRRLTSSLRLAWTGLLAYFVLFSLPIWKLHGYPTLDPTVTYYAIPALFGAAFAACFALAVPGGRVRRLIAGLGAVGAAGIITEASGAQNWLTVNQLTIPLQTVINTIIPLIYLHYLTKSARTSLLAVPLFWISLGRLVSSLTSTLYDALRAPLVDSSRELLINWLCFQLCVTIGCNIVYAVGFWKTRK